MGRSSLQSNLSFDRNFFRIFTDFFGIFFVAGADGRRVPDKERLRGPEQCYPRRSVLRRQRGVGGGGGACGAGGAVRGESAGVPPALLPHG